MDEPGRLSHARPRQGPRRVQLDGARLQSATGAQHSRRRKADGGRGRMNDARNCPKSGGESRSGSSRRRQGRDSRPRQQKSIKARETHIVNGLTPDFSHGLLRFEPLGNASRAESAGFIY